MRRRFLSVLIVVAGLVPVVASAQGVQTGALMGSVKSSDGVVISEAAVTVTSPALQGERTTRTDVNGIYVLAALPPGSYTVRITKSGLSSVELTALVPLGGTASADATLPVASASETVVVEGVTPPAATAIQTSANITAAEVNVLPMGRTPFLIAELMPGLTNNTPSANQLTISGGFAFDNVFLVDGVDVNDNLLGTANDLFIEDAISEVQVLTSGVSAEYGRFSGGVINIITKSGGNTFGGSYRTTFMRPSWTSETPFEKTNNIERGKPTPANPFLNNKLSHFSELTAGGPVVKNRVWFFGAGRFENSSTAGTMPATAVAYTKTNDSKRYEGKVTGTARPGHTLQGSFIDNRVHRGTEPVLSFSIDRAALISPSTPNRLGVVNYNGALSPRMLVSAQYSQKRFATVGVGGTSTAIIDSPFLTRSGTQYQYNAPYFDATDPERRNNRQLTASATYFASDRRLGSHELKGGFEHFVDTRVGAGAQSSTGYVFISNFKVDAAGAPVLDVEGHPVPQFVPGTSRVQRWIPHRGAELNIATSSAYLQDRWIVSPNLTLNLGMRFEHVSGEATGDISSANTSRIVPRVGASYDIDGDGVTVLQASFSQYSGKYNAQQFSRNSNVGNSDRYTTVYNGPAGEGRGFAPGFNVNNYSGVVAGTFPALNVRFADDLSSPVTTEYTLGAARTFGARSYGKIVFVQRQTSNFIEEFITLANGTTPIVVDGATISLADNIVYDNSDEMKRGYRALQFMGQHRVMRAVTVNGHWTLQLKNNGNFEGETPNPAGTAFGDYPELLSLERSVPDGRLDDFQRSKVRVWADYHANLGRYGSLTVAPIFRYNSAKTYSLVLNNQALSAIQLARNPGYAGTPLQQIFFGERGSQSFESFSLMDLAVTYGIPVWRSAQPWIKFEAFNVLNNQKLIAWDTTITAAAGGLDANGLPTSYVQGPRFGQGTANVHYAVPRPGTDGGRMFDFAIGLRF
ncbi:MAG TPA: TonB-dependent receptor [Vicinamibacterales bacterium]|nr:TonB-dependent receptor [Vicinamibacterales bacterium]